MGLILDCPCKPCCDRRNIMGTTPCLHEPAFGSVPDRQIVGEALPLKAHPLYDEVIAKLESGEITIGCPMTPTGEVSVWTQEHDENLRKAIVHIEQAGLRKEPTYARSIPTMAEIMSGDKVSLREPMSEREAAIKMSTDGVNTPTMDEPNVLHGEGIIIKPSEVT
jgi:hypothetical protein